MPAFNRKTLTCAICQGIFESPFTLLCQHTFCKDCISSVADRKCPVCHHSFILTANKNNIIGEMCDVVYPEGSGVRKSHALDEDTKLRNKQIEEINKVLLDNHIKVITEEEKTRPVREASIINVIRRRIAQCLGLFLIITAFNLGVLLFAAPPWKQGGMFANTATFIAMALDVVFLLHVIFYRSFFDPNAVRVDEPQYILVHPGMHPGMHTGIPEPTPFEMYQQMQPEMHTGQHTGQRGPTPRDALRDIFGNDHPVPQQERMRTRE